MKELKFPVAKEVFKSKDVTLAYWYRFLPDPKTQQENSIFDLIREKLFKNK